MAQHRLFHPADQQQALSNYHLELHQIIDFYIQNRTRETPGSKGIARANKIKQLIGTQLLLVEGLDSAQLMWRMLDYVERLNAADMPPFENSNMLRGMVLNNMCALLRISKQSISAEAEKVLERELAAAKQSVFPFCAPVVSSAEDRCEAAKGSLVKQALLRRVSVQAVKRGESGYLGSLLGVLRRYEEYATTSCFKADGKKRAAMMRLVVKDWCDVQGLNEQQLLSRVVEQISLPANNDYGLLETSQDLRARITRGMFAYMGLDERVIQQAMLGIRKQAYLYKPSNFGPVFLLHDHQAIEVSLRLEQLSMALEDRAAEEVVTFTPFVCQ